MDRRLEQEVEMSVMGRFQVKEWPEHRNIDKVLRMLLFCLSTVKFAAV